MIPTWEARDTSSLLLYMSRLHTSVWCHKTWHVSAMPGTHLQDFLQHDEKGMYLAVAPKGTLEALLKGIVWVIP